MIDLTDCIIETFRQDGEFAVARAKEPSGRLSWLAISPVLEQPAPSSLAKLEHAFALRSELDSSWAAQPVALTKIRGRLSLVIEDPGGQFVDDLMRGPLPIADFLRLSIGIAAAVGGLHARGLVHKDIKPANLIANASTGQTWLTGFSLATRLPRHRQSAETPEIIAGTLAYMAPEQTGRMNRSIDSRSDLYSLGVTLYQMLTGVLPFAAADALEWVHCHIARQPVAPIDRRDVPQPLSAIIMKLLAKNAEERYQTAAGVEADLRRCMAQWRSHGHLDSFSLAADDRSGRLLIPEKLYGREREVDALVAAFGRVVDGGKPELVLVSGYSGVGKSAVVNELHKSLVPNRGLFSSGKFDQYKRDIPYATVAQAFQGLIRPLLSKPEAELSQWRDELSQALSPNGSLVVDLVPELKLIIGEQPPVVALPPQEAKTRAHLAFRRFISVFARTEHPLALFLDDLQWLDAATLEFLEDLLVQQDLAHLLVVGAYRDNEVDAAHPLMRRLSAIRQTGAAIQEIYLTPLRCDDLVNLVADTFHCDPKRATPLAQLIHQKTAGSPFFAIQFIPALCEEGLITFEQGDARWHWDLEAIHAKRHTDNVADLMVNKLNRLSVKTQRALQQFACIGNDAEAATLSAVLESSEEEAEAELSEALHLELIVRSDDSYRFAHDRVQEAAYSLITVEARAEAHLRIGRLLNAHNPPEKRDEAIFEIVSQLNRGAELITSQEERFQLAELNLVAGERAKASTAYASALQYFIAGQALLANDCWERRPDLIFQLELHRAECEFLTGELSGAAERVEMLRLRASNTIELAAATCVGIDVYVTINQNDRAVAICLDYLRRLGIEWPAHPTEEQARDEYERTLSQLGNRAIEEFIDFPLMSDPASIATLDVLTRVWNAALFTDSNLSALVTCRAVSLSIEHGNNDGSCLVYVCISNIAGYRFGDYKNAFRFGQLGFDLVEKRGLKRFQAASYVNFAASVMPWIKHLPACCGVMRQTFEIANRIGDLTYAVYSRIDLNSLLIARGDPLDEMQNEAEYGLNFAQKAKFGYVAGIINSQLGLIRTLRGLTVNFGSFDHPDLNEAEFESNLLGKCWYLIRKLQACYFAGDFASALEASLKARPLLLASPSFELAEYEFYSALVRAALWDISSTDQRRGNFDALAAHHNQLTTWAEHCPENFQDRAALVGAEIARIEGRELEAQRLYEKAIKSACSNGFVHNEAIANEVAARFYAARGYETISNAYLRNARDCYLRWGADGKVRQLDQLYPHLAAPEQRHSDSLNATTSTSVGRLDAETVAKASQALSSEIVLPGLIERLMRIAVEHAGAERGLLILLRGREPLIEAQATTSQGSVAVQVRQTEINLSDLPTSALHYVIRTRERVVLDDASVANPYSDDEYLRQRKAKSVLCLPIVKQSILIGVLYLENNLTPHVFTSARLAVLEMLASQAAISLENARLYAALQRGEAYLAEAQKLSCTGSFGWNLTTDEHFWSEETFRIFEYEVCGNVTMQMVRGRIHPEDVPLLNEVITRAINGDGFDCEYRLLMPTGKVKQVHVVAHVLRGESGDRELVGAVSDITAQRRAEAALRQAQAELAHVTRVTTMGELAASIAHEVNQPIAGVVTNGNACLRWLSRVQDDSVNLKEARESVQRIIRDGNRAGEIIARIRALFKKTELVREPLDLNEVIREIIALARNEMNSKQVTLRLELQPGLPHVAGDRVQLQQVMLNLILNAVDAMTTIEGRCRDLVILTQAVEEYEVMVTVRDSGIGLSHENIENVFKAFHTTKPGGLGMGLSISRSIVENHAGRLWLAEHEGPGASFCLSLPSLPPKL